jgi:hypothetical protein
MCHGGLPVQEAEGGALLVEAFMRVMQQRGGLRGPILEFNPCWALCAFKTVCFCAVSWTA